MNRSDELPKSNTEANKYATGYKRGLSKRQEGD
jgi:hypothetical protein